MSNQYVSNWSSDESDSDNPTASTSQDAIRRNSSARNSKKKSANDSSSPKKRKRASAGYMANYMRNYRKKQKSTNIDVSTLGIIRPSDELVEATQKFYEFCMTQSDMECYICHEAFPSKEVKNHVCTVCKKDPIIFSASNGMNPGVVPVQLQNLTMIEQLLIALASSVMKIFQAPGGQYVFRGHVISFPQDISVLASVLPRLSSELNILVIKKKYTDNFVELKVRRKVVLEALLWLQGNNEFYKNIKICYQRIQELPEDGYLTDLPCVCNDKDTPEIPVVNDMSAIITSQETSVPHDNAELGYVEGGMLSENIGCQVDVVKQALQDLKDGGTLDWPKVGSEPLKQMSEPGILTKTFPCLFPNGKCELNQTRLKAVTDKAFFQHLMRYKDQRFSSHPSFKYYALNLLMRQEYLTKGSLFYIHNFEKLAPTVEELKEKLTTEKLDAVAKNVIYFGGNQFGSASYWSSEKKKLNSMIDQIGNPSFFNTYSAADLHWVDLQNILRKYGGVTTSGLNKSSKFPLHYSWWFQERFSFFLKNVLPHIYKITDYWARFEFQSRGVTHVHLVLWIDGAPIIPNLSNISDEFSKSICNYFAQYVCTWLHGNKDDIRQRINLNNPLQKDPRTIKNIFEDLQDLAFYVQIHKICKSYCLKYSKEKKIYKCRFGFPIPETTTANFDNSESITRFAPERNEVYLNKFNPDSLRIWRANEDCCPIIDIVALFYYLMKYVSKSEKKSKDITKIFRTLVMDDELQLKTTTSILQKLLMRLSAERDYSSFEVCHLLMDYPLVLCSRKFVDLKMPTEFQYSFITNSRGNESAFTKMLNKYRKRVHTDSSLTNISWLKFIQLFNVEHQHEKVIRRSGKEVVVNVYPRLVKDVTNNMYCRNYLLLHKPHTCNSDLISGHQTYVEAYAEFMQCQDNINEEQVDNMDIDYSECSDESDNDSSNQYARNPWMTLSSVRPAGYVDTDDALGRRPLDTFYDWGESFKKYESVIPEALKFIENQKSSKPIDAPVLPTNVTLNDEQQAVVDKVIDYLLNNKNPDEQLLLLLQGVAGSGKSTVIKEIVNAVTRIFGPGKVLLTAPTGIAANALGGRTIHSALGFKLNITNVPHLTGLKEKRLQELFDGILILIIDEFSMIGLRFLAAIDKRCRQARPGFCHFYFGNVIVILVGDLGQLPPVCDRSVYTVYKPKEKPTPTELEGLKIFSEFKCRMFLKTLQRQAWVSEQDIRFKEALNNLRNGISTEEDFNLFATRHVTNLPAEEIQKFANAPRAFAYRADADAYNMERLRLEKNPVCRILSNDFGNVTKSSLKSEFLVSIGSIVMLKNNLWIEGGLVNGSVGIVRDIVFKSESSCPPEMPLFILVEFCDYKGKPLFENERLVPILPVKDVSQDERGNFVSRTQFPLVLAYGVTIHKTQSLTLKQLVINLGPKEFACGLSYVAFSRVTSLDDIIIEGKFTYDRIGLLHTNEQLQNRVVLEQSFE